jgi:2-polyprenyl-3-methyl-5-hydroxy-6-metoxy-1,4-benzoquinol methylase
MDPKIKWNSKYIERITQNEEPTPNPRLKNLTPYFSGGEALDLACGLGGNSLFLARLNYQVKAIDISEVAIHYLQEQATKQKLSINTQICSLSQENLFEIASDFYDVVVITYFLDRSLFPLIKKIIKSNGYFFMETFYTSPQSENQGISKQFKLKPKELLMEFLDWKVLYFEENEKEGRQTIFCQRIDC